MIEVNPKKLRPYGDRIDDGFIQLSFTLPVKASPEAKEAAKELVEKMYLERVSVISMEPLGDDFSLFVVYGQTTDSVDLTKIKVPKVDVPELTYQELVDLMEQTIAEPIVVVGACTGSDAHTVGIDAILNMKGYAGDYGLERYPKFKVHNLRSQLSNEELIAQAVELKADALLVSQVVSQRDSHIKNLKELKELLKKERRLPKGLITLIGGPRIDHRLALKLGFDAGFGRDTKPSRVASFIVKEYCDRTELTMKKPEKSEQSKQEEQPKRQGRPAMPVAVDDADMAIDEETMEDSYAPLVYQRPTRGQIRQPAEGGTSTLLTYRRPPRGAAKRDEDKPAEKRKPRGRRKPKPAPAQEAGKAEKPGESKPSRRRRGRRGGRSRRKKTT